jgi:outer membrane protein TolC
MAAEPAALSLEGFLGQIKAQGPGYRSAANAVEGLGKQKAQADLAYSPQLVAHAVRMDDREQQPIPILYGDRTLADDYGVALVKKWKYGGLTTSFDYGWTRSQVDGSSLAPSTPSYQLRPSASVTLPLWRDFLGRQTRAQMDKMKFEIESAEYSTAYAREGLLFQARNAYWGLQLTRDELVIRKDTLARAVTLVSWSQRRVSMRLADDSEALQARAAKQVRELELEQAQENERNARVAFNRLRGVEGDAVPEVLDTLDLQAESLSFQWPKDAPKRWDIRSAESKIKSDKAAWVDAKANAWPDFNVFASYTANGLDNTYGGAYQDGSKGRYPTAKVGGAITIPLDVFTAKKAADGYELNYQSSKSSYDDKTLSARQDWLQLKQSLEDVNRRLGMATEIEKIQKAKVEQERHQLSLGRSTQFQVQSYETDYALSRLQRLAVTEQKLAVWAQGEWMLSADRETVNK